MKPAREWFIQTDNKGKYGAYEALGKAEAQGFGGIHVIEKVAYDELKIAYEALTKHYDKLVIERYLPYHDLD